MITGNSVYVTRSFDCSAAQLFQWLTKPELIARWFGPADFEAGHVELQFNEGGSYEIELCKAGIKAFSVTGKYITIKEPELLEFSFEYQGAPSAPPPSNVRITLTAQGPQQTELRLVQKFNTAPPDMEGREKGWNGIFDKLQRQLLTLL